MSEYQHLYFAAVNRPLSDKQIAYMRQQSARAKIWHWEWTNEHHIGGFRENTVEMHRCGRTYVAISC